MAIDLEFFLRTYWDIDIADPEFNNVITVDNINEGLIFELDFNTTGNTVESSVSPEYAITSGFTLSDASLSLFDNRTITPYALQTLNVTGQNLILLKNEFTIEQPITQVTGNSTTSAISQSGVTKNLQEINENFLNKINTLSGNVFNALQNVDATLLNDNDGNYYLNRGNHTGTQNSGTIEDFELAVSAVVNTYNFSTSGTNAFTLSGLSPSFYLDRINHTGTQSASTISDFSASTSAIVDTYITQNLGVSTALTMSQSAITTSINSLSTSISQIPISSGTTINSVLTWNGNDWVENTTASIVSGGTVTATTLGSVAFGNDNLVTAPLSFIAGGSNNTITSDVSFIGAGQFNNASNFGTFIAGQFNNASASLSSIFGFSNTATTTANASFISGSFNTSNGQGSVTFGGFHENNSLGTFIAGVASSPITGQSTDSVVWTDELFKLGNGLATGSTVVTRNNALVVYKNGTIEINPAIDVTDNTILTSATLSTVGTVTNRLYNIDNQLYWNGQVLAIGTGSTISDGTTVNSTLRWDGTDWIEATNLLNDGSSSNTLSLLSSGITLTSNNSIDSSNLNISSSGVSWIHNAPNDFSIEHTNLTGGNITLTSLATTGSSATRSGTLSFNKTTGVTLSSSYLPGINGYDISIKMDDQYLLMSVTDPEDLPNASNYLQITPYGTETLWAFQVGDLNPIISVPNDGTIRYNTFFDEFQGYENGVWKKLVTEISQSSGSSTALTMSQSAITEAIIAVSDSISQIILQTTGSSTGLTMSQSAITENDINIRDFSINRANHIGVQSASTIIDFNESVSGVVNSYISQSSGSSTALTMSQSAITNTILTQVTSSINSVANQYINVSGNIVTLIFSDVTQIIIHNIDDDVVYNALDIQQGRKIDVIITNNALTLQNIAFLQAFTWIGAQPLTINPGQTIKVSLECLGTLESDVIAIGFV